MKYRQAADNKSILSAIQQCGGEASINEILAHIDLEIPRRTLQRRLQALVASGELEREGKRRGAYYKLAISQRSGTLKLEDAEEGFPLSIPGREIKQCVTQPIFKRTPIGYRRDFLDGYRPNHSQYLTRAICQHLHRIGDGSSEGQPAGTYTRKILDRFLIDLSWNSSRLEGNTYSLLETQRLIKLGETAQGRDIVDAQMILNHKAAIEFLVNSAEETDIDPATVLNLHALLSKNLLPNPDACGRLREIPVGISKTVYLPLEIPQLVADRFHQLLNTAKEIKEPFEQAFFLMVHLPYLQAFEDVNKRVSRLAANLPLIKNNICPISFIDVPKDVYVHGLLGVYELNQIELLRDVFIWAYERSCTRYSSVQQSLGEPDPFKFRYRTMLETAVSEVVKQMMTQQQANKWILDWVDESIPLKDQSRFVEIAQIELMSLHEGNIACYRLRPSEFTAWQRKWKK